MPPTGPDSSFNFEHHRKVILVLDTVESVRLMESDEQGFIHRWHQFVFPLEGEMETIDQDNGEVYHARPGDVLLWAPGLHHTIGGKFRVIAVRVKVQFNGYLGRPNSER